VKWHITQTRYQWQHWQNSTWNFKKTRCIGTTWMSPPWILMRLANCSPFFNSLSNRLTITNYCSRSVSSSLLKFARFIHGNNIAWTNLDMIRNLQHLHLNKKSYTYKTLPLIVIEFFSELKVSCGLSNNNHCKLLTANVLQRKQGPIRRLWWGWSHTVVGHLFWNANLLFHKEMEWYCD
jgi:hypothetical protein